MCTIVVVNPLCSIHTFKFGVRFGILALKMHHIVIMRFQSAKTQQKLKKMSINLKRALRHPSTDGNKSRCSSNTFDISGFFILAEG
jgi:hypothetical protein